MLSQIHAAALDPTIWWAGGGGQGGCVSDFSVIIHSFSSLSHDRYKASSKPSSSHSANYSFRLQI
jgi:hypothetical protein